MSKSILTIDTPKGCVFCPLAKMHGFNAFHNYVVKQETVMDMRMNVCITNSFEPQEIEVSDADSN